MSEIPYSTFSLIFLGFFFYAWHVLRSVQRSSTGMVVLLQIALL